MLATVGRPATPPGDAEPLSTPRTAEASQSERSDEDPQTQPALRGDEQEGRRHRRGHPASSRRRAAKGPRSRRSSRRTRDCIADCCDAPACTNGPPRSTPRYRDSPLQLSPSNGTKLNGPARRARVHCTNTPRSDRTSTGRVMRSESHGFWGRETSLDHESSHALSGPSFRRRCRPGTHACGRADVRGRSRTDRGRVGRCIDRGGCGGPVCHAARPRIRLRVRLSQTTV